MSDFIFVNCSAIAIRKNDVICLDGANHKVLSAEQDPNALRMRTLVIEQITEGPGQGEIRTIHVNRSKQLSRQASAEVHADRARRSRAFIETTATEVPQ